VLKNIHKAEHFIVEQLQRIIQKKVVFPNLFPTKLPGQPSQHQQSQPLPPNQQPFNPSLPNSLSSASLSSMSQPQQQGYGQGHHKSESLGRL
jgi:hypothetical protein